MARRGCRTRDLFFFGREQSEDQCHTDSDGNLRRTMERGNPWRTYPRQQQDNRQCDASEPVRVVVRADGRAKEPQYKYGNAEYKGARLKKTRDDSTEYCSDQRSHETLPGNLPRCAQRRLRDDDGCDRSPIRPRKTEHPRHQKRSESCRACSCGMDYDRPAQPLYMIAHHASFTLWCSTFGVFPENHFPGKMSLARTASSRFSIGVRNAQQGA